MNLISDTNCPRYLKRTSMRSV